MLLGLSYAQFVAVLGGGMLAFEPPAHPDLNTDAVVVSVDHMYKKRAQNVRENVLSLELKSSSEWFWGFKPTYAAGIGSDGSGYAALGLRKDYRWGNFELSPFIGPAIYQSKVGTWKSEELLQFRSGLNLTYKISDTVDLGVGVYHLSNAKMNTASADKDMRRILLQIRY